MRRPLVIVLLLALLILAPFIVTNRYFFHMITISAIWAVFAISLNLILGYLGLLSIAHGAFFGIGGYSVALLMTEAGWNFWPALLAGVVLAALCGLVIGLLTLRLEGHYFAIGTLAFGIVMQTIIEKWDTLTHGSRGVTNIPYPSALSLGFTQIEFSNPANIFYLISFFLIAMTILAQRIYSSPFGRTLVAIRGNQSLAQSLGINLTNYKLITFMVSAGIASVSGSLYAVYFHYIHPTDAGFWTGFNGVVYVVVGGLTTWLGPIIGSAIMLIVPEVLRALQDYRLLIFGLLVIVVVVFAPKGIVGSVQALIEKVSLKKEAFEKTAINIARDEREGVSNK